jgi:hypothetical protein
MPFTYNGNTPDYIKYNGNEVKTLQFNGVTVWNYVSPVSNMYPEETKTFAADYYTNAGSVNNSNAQIGRATEDVHTGGFIKVPAPADWSKITSMKLKLYRRSGSAAGDVRVGVVSSLKWTDALPFTALWRMAEENYVSINCTGNEGWKDFDITSMKSKFQAAVQSGYFIMTVINRSAYMFADMSVETSYSPWIQINNLPND